MKGLIDCNKRFPFKTGLFTTNHVHNRSCSNQTAFITDHVHNREHSQRVCNDRELVLRKIDNFNLNGPRIFRGPCANGDRVNAWSLLCILRELNRHWSVKWTMKHSLHYWY